MRLSDMHLRPLPGVTVMRVRDVLLQVHTDVGNERTRGGTAFERFNAYQAWSNKAVSQLESILDGRSVERLVTTPRYWALQGLAPADHGNLAGLVDLELESRVRVLDQAVRAVRDDASRYGEVCVPVVPDTNTLVHQAQPFDQQDWNSLAAARMDAVTLFIPLVVIDELDALKRSVGNKVCVDGGKETVRSRARTSLRTIDSLFSSPNQRAMLQPKGELTGPVFARLLLDPPGHKRADRADDEIVDLSCALADYTGRGVLLATTDTGLRMRARHRELTTIDMP